MESEGNATEQTPEDVHMGQVPDPRGNGTPWAFERVLDAELELETQAREMEG